MNQKIKLFYDSSPEELAEHANVWIQENPGIKVQQIQTEIGSELAISGGGTAMWNGMSYLTLLYEEKESA